MKKKWLGMGMSVGVCAVLLWGAGMPAYADNSGAGAYQAALKQTKAETSLTAHGTLDVTDNGKPLFTMSGEAKLDLAKQEASVTRTLQNAANATSQTLQTFREDGKLIVKKENSEVYYVIELAGWKAHRPDSSKLPAVIVDRVLENLRAHSTVENLPDGGKHVSLQLAGDELSPLADKAASLWFSKIAAFRSAAQKDLPVLLPQLTQDIEVEQVSLNATIDKNNRIERQSAEFHVSGRDQAGQQHALVMKLDVALSDFSQTTVEHVDLTGKQVKYIDWQRPVWKPAAD